MRWDDDHDMYIDLFMGRYIGVVPHSRGYALSRLILRDDASGLAPAEVSGGDRAARAAWAQVEMYKHLAAEVERLRAHRATLDPARHAVSKAQSPDRVVMSFNREAQLAHGYQFAALRTMHRAVDQIHRRRKELGRKLGPPEQSRPPSRP